MIPTQSNQIISAINLFRQLCTGCSSYFCWICLEVYRSARRVYHHACPRKPKPKRNNTTPQAPDDTVDKAETGTVPALGNVSLEVTIHVATSSKDQKTGDKTEIDGMSNEGKAQAKREKEQGEKPADNGKPSTSRAIERNKDQLAQTHKTVRSDTARGFKAIQPRRTQRVPIVQNLEAAEGTRNQRLVELR